MSCRSNHRLQRTDSSYSRSLGHSSEGFSSETRFVKGGFLQKDIKRAMGLPHVICMAAPPQFNANAQLICLNGQQSQAIDTFLNASSTDDGQVGTLYRVYLWHYLYVIQLAVFKFFISYWF